MAARVAGLVEDGATVQFGIGALPGACLDGLAGHRDLGIHSGLLNDAAMRLIQAGVATGTRKTVDPGVAVGGFLGGSAALFRFAHRNVAVRLRGTGYTHDPAVLAAQRRLVAINSACEVDLSGQVNAEVARGRYVGLGRRGQRTSCAARRGQRPAVFPSSRCRRPRARPAGSSCT